MQERVQSGQTMSMVVRASIADSLPSIRDLWPRRPHRLLLATSRVTDGPIALECQGPGARRLGRRLLVELARGNRRSIDDSMAPAIFDTDPAGAAGHRPLTLDTLPEVAYASTRMLHAWEEPASIGDQAHVDGSYTCHCPVEALRRAGCDRIIAIANEPLPVPVALGSSAMIAGDDLMILAPGIDPASHGVDFLRASAPGLALVATEGQARARALLERHADRILA